MAKEATNYKPSMQL